MDCRKPEVFFRTSQRLDKLGLQKTRGFLQDIVFETGGFKNLTSTPHDFDLKVL